MKHKIHIKGVIIPNDYKWYYNFFKEDSTCPRDIEEVLAKAAAGDEIEVDINSPGGVIDAGSEIYTLLREAAERLTIRMRITGQACSAASIAAMAAYCEMSPTALMMVHCVSSGVRGNHSAMEHMAEVLRTADQALCTAYMGKTGMSQEEALDMMEKETWLTAEQAKEKGLVDAIMFEKEEELPLINGILFDLPTEDMMEQARKMLKEAGTDESKKASFLLQQKLNLMKLRGEKR